MKTIFTLLFFVVLSVNYSKAQDFEYGTYNTPDIDLKNTVIDSNANAVVIREFGSARIRIDDTNGRSSVYFEYHVKIKIFNKEGFQQGNIEIPQWIREESGERTDELEDLTASTFNLINGQIVRTDLDKKQVFQEHKNKYLLLTKFTMPNLKEGSVIEYSYHLNIPSVFNFKTWTFQSDIPKLYSEYVASLPAIYNYNVTIRGPLKLASSNGEVEKECLRISGTPIDCSKMTYIMKNIPAFTEEEYMTSAANFKSAIYFELSDVQLLTGAKQSFTKTWKDVDYDLVKDEAFGNQLKKKDLFKEIMPGLLQNTSDELSKAKLVYDYIKKNIKWNKYYGSYSENTIKKALSSHTGNIGDINLALVTALSAAGLDAEAVILSTRENGVVNPLFPVITDFNYVIAKVNIGDQSYLLDASDPVLPFGLLPLRCINDKGRVINLKKPSYWYDLKASQKESTRYSLNGELTPEGKIKGVLTIYSMGYAALNKRKQILAANSVDDFVENMDEQMPKIRILKHEINNLDSLDQSLVEKYDIEINEFENPEAQQLFFNPFLIGRTTKNPFNLNERTYPVDLGSASDNRISLSIKLPESYTLVDQPKDLAIALPDQGGRYLTRTSFDAHVLTFDQLFQLNKPIYGSNEYLSLKEFYSRIIQLQKTDFILKKSN